MLQSSFTVPEVLLYSWTFAPLQKSLTSLARAVCVSMCSCEDQGVSTSFPLSIAVGRKKSPAFKTCFSLHSQIKVYISSSHVQPLNQHDFYQSSDHPLLEGLIQRNNIHLTPQSINGAVGDEPTLFGFSVLTKLLVANKCSC